MLLAILLFWCFKIFSNEVSTNVKEYAFEKHRERIVEDLQIDLYKNIREICYNGKTIGYYYKGAYGNYYVSVV